MRWQGRPESKNIEDRTGDDPSRDTMGELIDGDFETGGGFGGTPYPPQPKPAKELREFETRYRKEMDDLETAERTATKAPTPRPKPKNTGSKREYPKN